MANTNKAGFNSRIGEKEDYVIDCLYLDTTDPKWEEFTSKDYDIDVRHEGVYITTRATGNGQFWPTSNIGYIKYHVKRSPLDI